MDDTKLSHLSIKAERLHFDMSLLILIVIGFNNENGFTGSQTVADFIIKFIFGKFTAGEDKLVRLKKN